MDSEYSTPFSKAILTGVFAGIITTLICLVYDLFYRSATDFSVSDLINVSSVIFLVNLIFLAFGLIYYYCVRLSWMGNVFYMVAISALTVVTALKSASVHRSDDLRVNHEFEHLLTILVLIIGIIGAFGIPALYNSKKFEEHVI